MSTLGSAMDNQERLREGEKLVVTAFMPAILAEGFLLPLALAVSFSWPGLIFGTLTFVVLLWATGKLYNGQPNARLVGEALGLVQVVVSLVCTILLAYDLRANLITSNFAQPVLWIAVLKLGAYLILASILLFRREVLDFMAVQRGEEATPVEPVRASSVVVTFTEAQKERFGRLASLLSSAGCVLFIAGLLFIGWSFSAEALPRVSPEGVQASLPSLGPWLGRYLLPGLVALFSGFALWVTAPSARRVETEGTDRAYLVNLLGSLKTLFRWQMLLTALGVVAALTSLVVLLKG